MSTLAMTKPTCQRNSKLVLVTNVPPEIQGEVVTRATFLARSRGEALGNHAMGHPRPRKSQLVHGPEVARPTNEPRKLARRRIPDFVCTLGDGSKRNKHGAPYPSSRNPYTLQDATPETLATKVSPT